ncbi:MAG: hypothetical protein KDA51_19660, partial [Planctomycetales bacterium]|nr:hypothetical protein [Planctomycetales bacterium]
GCNRNVCCYSMVRTDAKSRQRIGLLTAGKGLPCKVDIWCGLRSGSSFCLMLAQRMRKTDATLTRQAHRRQRTVRHLFAISFRASVIKPIEIATLSDC